VVGLSNQRIKKGLLLSLASEKVLEIGEFWQSYKQEGGCLVHVVRLATTLLEEEEFTRQLEYGEKQLLLTGYIESTEQSRTAEHLIGCIFCQ